MMKTYREVLCPDCHRKYMTYVYCDELCLMAADYGCHSLCEGRL